MALKADSQGFLIGDTVDISRAVDHLRSIKNDVAAIRRAVIPTAARRNSETRSAANVPRDSTGRFIAANMRAGQSATSATKAVAEVISAAQKDVRIRKVMPKAVEPNSRDSRGRFSSGGGDGSASNSSGWISGVAGRIASAVKESAVGAEEVDPTIKAAQEVAEPLKRGYSVLFGGDEKPGKWLRKIFGTLSVFRKEETVYNKASTKVLKNIEEKTGLGGDGEGSFSGGAAGSLLGRFLPWLIGGIAGIGTAIVGGIGTVLAPLGSMLLTGVTTVLGAVFSPIGLAIGAAATLAWGMFTEDGKKLFSDIGGKISEAWDSAVTSFKETFPGVTKAFEGAATSISNLFQPIIDFFKDKFGIVGDVAQKTVEVVKEQVSDTGNYLSKSSPKTMEALSKAKNWAGDAWGSTKSAGGKVIESFKNVIPGMSSETGSAEKAMQILMGKGWTKEQAAGIAANLQAESGFKTNAVGDSGKAMGIAQWHPDRQRKFKEVFGKDLSSASFEEQMNFVDWELRNTEKAAGEKIMAANSSGQAAAATERYYERSALGLRGGVQAERLANASRYSQMASVSTSIPSPSSPVISQPPKIADAPEIQIPLNSVAERPITVNMPSQDVGRDLSDRGLAHIATGGMCRAPG